MPAQSKSEIGTQDSSDSSSGVQNQLRRLDLSDIIDWRSVILWALPLWAFLATLALIQDFAGDTIANARVGNPDFRLRKEILKIRTSTACA